eukprot:COSAG01_NODE_8931_length_2598_cov_1.670251_5_plen_83_part_00
MVPPVPATYALLYRHHTVFAPFDTPGPALSCRVRSYSCGVRCAGSLTSGIAHLLVCVCVCVVSGGIIIIVITVIIGHHGRGH